MVMAAVAAAMMIAMAPPAMAVAVTTRMHVLDDALV